MGLGTVGLESKPEALGCLACKDDGLRAKLVLSAAAALTDAVKLEAGELLEAELLEAASAVEPKALKSAVY